MEEKGYIIVRFDGVMNGNKIAPSDVDISEIKKVISDIETFLYPSRIEKNNRPHISYSIESGSVKHKFALPITSVLLFGSIINEVAARQTTDFLDYKRAEIIEKYQKIAREKELEITFDTSTTQGKSLIINKNTRYFSTIPNWINTEFMLYGEVYQEGGIEPNFHIHTKEFGKLTVAATKQQILEGEKRIYRVYGLKATGKQNIETKLPYDLKLEGFIDYNPVFDKSQLDLLIAKAAPNLSKIKNVDTWLEQIREGGVYE